MYLAVAESDDPADLCCPHSIKCLDPGSPLFRSDFQPRHKVSEQSEDESPTARKSRNLEVLNCFLTGSCLHFPILFLLFNCCLSFGRLELDTIEVVVLLILLIHLKREMPGVALLDYFLDVVCPEERLAVHGKGLAVFELDECVAAWTDIFPEPESDLAGLLVEIKGNVLEPVAYHLLHVAVERHASFVDGHIRREKHATSSASVWYEFLVCHLLSPPFLIDFKIGGWLG